MLVSTEPDNQLPTLHTIFFFFYKCKMAGRQRHMYSFVWMIAKNSALFSEFQHFSSA